ncbi:hypothetical protein GQ44DRAFT_779006 [Phaeosphaeriaceae sp. PMI808]|nr:hypothetical protein GQ44DRAFT_779006 [Phaeosphaeriaceae sp. PMI808]
MRGGHERLFKYLLRIGEADVDFRDRNNVNTAAGDEGGRTALQAAVGGGHLAVVERLLEEKANVNAAAAGARWGRRTALQAAAEGGHLAVVERLRLADIQSRA